MAVNAFGGSVFDIAVALLVLQHTGSAVAMGWIVILETIPMVFPGLLIGAIADRKAARTVILIGYGGQAVIVTVAAVILAGGYVSVAILGAAVFIRASFDIFARAGTFAAVPTVYGDQSEAFNSLFRLTWTSVSVAGPVVGGALATTVAPAWLFAADAASFLVMTLVMAALPLPRAAFAAERSKSICAQVMAAIHTLCKLEGARRFCTSVALNEMAVAPALPIALYTVTVVHGKGSLELGFVNACVGAGLVAGSVASTLVVGTSPRRIMRSSTVIMAMGAGLAMLPSWQCLCVGIALLYAGGISFAVAQTNVMQRAVGQEQLGKLLTTVTALETVCGAITTYLVTTLVSHTAASAGFMVLAAILVVCLIVLIPKQALLPAMPAKHATSNRAPVPDPYI